MAFLGNGDHVKEPLVQVFNIKKHFRLPGGWLAGGRRYVYAVDGVSFDVAHGEVLGLVGESGCGKTTLGRLVLRLLAATEGDIIFDGHHLTKISSVELRQLRQEMQLVFQNPLGSLSPRQKVLDIVSEPLKTHRQLNQTERREIVIELLEQVGMGAQHLDRYPHEISGGAVPAGGHCPRSGLEAQAAHSG